MQCRRLMSAVLGLALLSATAAAENWPQFRGAHRDNISRETGLLRQWPEGGPKVLWSIEVCQGYAAAAIHSGRVYFNDYDPEANEWFVRCVALADGKELWRYKDAKRIRPNHGITRTVPAVDDKYVFSLDPKCVFHCLDAATGKELWRKSFVRDYKAQIPPWYNGQCPLIEADRVIIAPGGEALMVALKKDTGEGIWRTPNPEKWPLSHASVMPAELGGVKQYLWCTLFGPLGVSAADGKLLWFQPRKFNVAVAPSPLAIGDDRVFMTSGYEAGSIMLRLRRESDSFAVETVFDMSGEEWNSEVHTPILFEDRMFAVGRKKRGLFTCMDFDGQEIWTSRGHASFDLGSYLLADGMFFVLEGKTGMLRLLEANTTEYRELASAQVFSGHDVWAPMAISDGKMVLRDMTKMLCIEIAPQSTARHASPASDLAANDCAPPALHLIPPASRDAQTPYRHVQTISGKGADPGQFSEALRGLALDANDQVYAVGDSAVKVYSHAGELRRTWRTARPSYCVTVAADGTVYVGEPEQIELFDAQGKLLNTWHDPVRLGLVTAIGFSGESVVIADVRDRCLRRYDRGGKFLNNIGKDNRMKGFLVPNRHLDLAVDASGAILAPNPGKHRVERYDADGKMLGRFGRFGGQDLAGFTGCCNPSNVALSPDGGVVVTVKADPHVKLFDAAGTLRGVVGVGEFDPASKNMDVAVDSRGRIYVADTARLEIRVYAQASETVQP